MDIDVKHIKMVETLARVGNFARAAKELDMTQPGLSRALQTLEKHLEIKLFDRGKREVTPTIYGRHIIQFGVHLVRDATKLERDLQLLIGKDSGELIIGTGPIPAETIIGEVIGRMIMLHPRIQIRVIVERPHALFAMLNRREIDVMIADIRGIELSDELVMTPLPQHPICFIARPNHPLSREQEISLIHIFRYPIATPWLPESIFTVLSQKTGQDASAIARFENGLVECNNFKILLEVVKHSEAVGCGLAVIFSQALAAGAVVSLPVTSGGLASQYQLVHLKRYATSPAMEVFRSLLLKNLQQEGTIKDSVCRESKNVS